MFARVARFERAAGGGENPFEQVRDQAIAILQSLPGWQGGMQLVDREGGNVMNIALFDSEENMRAAEPTFADMPNQVPDVAQLAARRSSVTYLEVPFGVLRGQEI